MRRIGKSRMLLLELLLAVFIFSACAIICAGVFLAANGVAKDSRDLSNATFLAATAAEAFKEATDDQELAAMLGGQISESGTVEAYFGSDWVVAPGAGGQQAAGQVGYVSIHTYGADGLYNAEIRVYTHAGGQIYALDTAKYMAGGGR